MKHAKLFIFMLIGLTAAGVLFSCSYVFAAGKAVLTWTANTESDLAGYRVYYRTSGSAGTYIQAKGSGINVGKTATPSAPSYTLTNLTNGLTYYFAITAYDTSGNESAYSPEVSKFIPAVYGDVNSSATVTAYDAALTAQAAVGLITFTSAQKAAADVNGSATVTAYDAALIAQRAVGLITKFPVEP